MVQIFNGKGGTWKSVKCTAQRVWQQRIFLWMKGEESPTSHCNINCMEKVRLVKKDRKLCIFCSDCMEPCHGTRGLWQSCIYWVQRMTWWTIQIYTLRKIFITLIIKVAMFLLRRKYIWKCLF
jgi:hypothetical protein